MKLYFKYFSWCVFEIQVQLNDCVSINLGMTGILLSALGLFLKRTVNNRRNSSSFLKISFINKSLSVLFFIIYF